MRTITASLLATTLMVSSTFAATESMAPLPSGKPAGVKEAAYLGQNMILVLLSAGIVIGGIALAVSSPGGNNVTTPTTTTTTTTTTTGTQS